MNMCYSTKMLGLVMVGTLLSLTGCASQTATTFRCGKAPNGFCEPLGKINERVSIAEAPMLPKPFQSDDGVSWSREGGGLDAE